MNASERYKKIKDSAPDKALLPPIKESGDTITITGVLKGLALISYKWDADPYKKADDKNVDPEDIKGAGILTFANKDGETVRKYINEFDREYLEKKGKSDDQILKMLNNQINNLIYLHTFYFKNIHTPSDAEIDEDGPNPIQQTLEWLFSEAPFEEAKYNGAVKMVFKKEEGAEPQYIVPMYNWFGYEKTLNLNLKGEYADLVTFTRVESTDGATFSSEGDEEEGDDATFVTTEEDDDVANLLND